MGKRFYPLYDKIALRRGKVEAQGNGSLIIVPDVAKEKAQEGEVIAVGTGRYEQGKLVPLTVKEGDTVLFGKHSGVDIKTSWGEELLILKEDDILGILL